MATKKATTKKEGEIYTAIGWFYELGYPIVVNLEACDSTERAEMLANVAIGRVVALFGKDQDAPEDRVGSVEESWKVIILKGRVDYCEETGDEICVPDPRNPAAWDKYITSLQDTDKLKDGGEEGIRIETSIITRNNCGNQYEYWSDRFFCKKDGSLYYQNSVETSIRCLGKNYIAFLSQDRHMWIPVNQEKYVFELNGCKDKADAESKLKAAVCAHLGKDSMFTTSYVILAEDEISILKKHLHKM